MQFQQHSQLATGEVLIILGHWGFLLPVKHPLKNYPSASYLFHTRETLRFL